MLFNNIFGILNTESRVKLVEKISSVVEMTLLMDFLLMDEDVRKLRKLLKLCKTFTKKLISNKGLLKIDRNMMSLFDNYNKIVKQCNTMKRLKLKDALSDSDSDDDDDDDDDIDHNHHNKKTNVNNKSDEEYEYCNDTDNDNDKSSVTI